MRTQDAVFLFEHLFLPPKLPQTDHNEKGADALLNEIANAAQEFAGSFSYATDERRFWQGIARSVSKWVDLYAEGNPCSSTIISSLKKLPDNDVLLFYVKAQNAAIVLRTTSAGAIFECFEVLPKNEAVLNAKDAVLRQFPARAVLLPIDELSDAFAEELGNAIHDLSIETLDLAMEKVHTENHDIAESRQPVHPKAVTEWLFGVLSSRGQPTSSPVIRKRTHDDVLQISGKPWRRSGVWLCARVALQLALQNAAFADKKQAHYKNFMMFLLARVAAGIQKPETSSDVLHVLHAKLARRNAKLGASTFDFVQDFTNDVLERINNIMRSKWSRAVERDKVHIERVPLKAVTNELALKNSQPYLVRIWKGVNERSTYSAPPFVPLCHDRVVLPKESLPKPVIFDNAGEMLSCLVEFEAWVGDELGNWSSSTNRDDSNCRALATLMQKYHAVAKQLYDGSPERMSKMLLTLALLWKALGIIATRLQPLLFDYPPEIPSKMFSPLLLNKKSELQRLSEIEFHIKSRENRCKSQHPSAFSDPSPNSFAVNFYDKSSHMAKLRKRITTDANSQRTAKLAELKRKKERYTSLMNRSNRAKCPMWTPFSWENGVKMAHKPRHEKPKYARCARCTLKEDAAGLTITKHEWPLPEEEVLCRSVVFELGGPEAFFAWRDGTFFLLHNIARTNAFDRQLIRHAVLSLPSLKIHVQKEERNITLASSVKGISGSHYIDTLLQANPNSLLIKNSLRLKMSDISTNIWTADQTAVPSLYPYCISMLSPTLQSLSQEVNSDSHNQNQIIARRSECPPEMGPHEHVLFGSLRSGERLQLFNVLGALMSTEIDLNSPAALSLVVNAIGQVGTPGKASQHYLRESQIVFLSNHFCQTLLDALEDAFARIQGNCKMVGSAAVLLAIALKVLSLSLFPEIAQRCMDLVLRIRDCGLAWIRQLTELYDKKKSDQDASTAIKDLSQQILNCCILTRRTYFHDENAMQTIFANPDALADYVEASIHLHTHRDSAVEEKHLQIENELLNDAYIARRQAPHVENALRRFPDALSQGIGRFWPSATFSRSWSNVHDGDPSWMQNHVGNKIVHYNLITGTLLVSGRAISRLPTPYSAGPLYHSIFGDLEVDVAAADIDSMEYMSKNLFCGHRVYFGLRGGILTIRCCKDGETFEALLKDQFIGDLPRWIIQNNTPWLSVSDGRVIFRPNERPWSSEPSDWTLFPAIHSRRTSHMSSDGKCLIDVGSTVGRIICNTLAPLERPEDVIITLSKNKSVNIKLPRYHLSFYVNEIGEIMCKELSAVVDRDQAIGSLLGLESRLVLQVRGKSSSSNVRTVLVPNGDVKVFPSAPHVRVHVNLHGDEDSRTFSQLRIDDRLGTLVASDLEAHFYKIYLHAITSLPQGDSLTGRSGTDEALLGLSDLVCYTCIPLSPRSQHLLYLIAGLSPVRQFYPVHLRMMQSASFNETLPVLSQRDVFFGTVDKIVRHNLKASCFFNAEVSLPSYDGDLALLDRSDHRTSKLYSSGRVAGSARDVDDKDYSSRDREVSRNLKASADIILLIQAWPSAFDVEPCLRDMVMQWKEVTGFEDEFTYCSLSSLLGEDFRTIFPSLMALCRSANPSKEVLTIVLSLLAFGNPELVPKLKAVLAFAISPTLKVLPSPDYGCYDLGEGYGIKDSEILALVSQCVVEFEIDTTSSESEVEEEDQTANEKEILQQQVKSEAQLILNAVKTSWPATRAGLPPKQQITHYQFGLLKDLLNGRLAVWHKNLDLLRLFENYDQNLTAFGRQWVAPKMLSTLVESRKTRPRQKWNGIPSLLELMISTPVSTADFGDSEPTRLDQDLSSSIANPENREVMDTDQAQFGWTVLRDITDDLSKDSSLSVRDYGKALEESVEAMKAMTGKSQNKVNVVCEDVLNEKTVQSRKHIQYILTRIRKLLRPNLTSQEALETAGLWPRISQLTLLQLLSPEYRPEVPACWMAILLQFAREITALSRVERIQKYLAAEDTFALNNELVNPAHSAWSTEDRPDWLLLEIQNNFLIRPTQIRVATELLKQENGIVLLGMGEGKTSVILPMFLVIAAQGQKLVRCVVLKPLATEMLRLLSRSMSGLVGRTIFHLPFSRQTPLSRETPRQLKSLYEECRQIGGVLLTLPEHLNSFRLVGSDKLGRETRLLAQELIELQAWLDCNSRDILDESDALLNTKYELVYTSGEANLLSNAPDRWNVALDMLALIQQNATALHTAEPTSLEVYSRGRGHFPHFRVLDDDGAKAVNELVAQAIIEGKLANLPLAHCSDDVLQAIKSFVLDINVEASQFELVSRYFQGSTKLDLLYVARGLIAYQIFAHTLSKRWLVNYGLDRSRTLSSVPYRAKSRPSPSAEFAQPETAIVLTGLSYHYTGLQRSDLRKCLVLLLRLPDPADAYAQWVRKSKVPAKFRTVTAVNLEDVSCVEELHKQLKYNSELIKFFLRHVVYPSEAKEFQFKLSTSAWDLCRNDKVVTVGFSGTNDSHVPIAQKDLPDLKHIAATTLTTLLKPENREYHCASSASGGRLPTKELLELIVNDQPPVSVVIDVGAQMLESNFEIARVWLELRTDKMAIIYFNDDDDKMVLNRDGSTESLASSIFKDELASCLIFLDEFHTRGTDFQMPDNFVAAVLLGPGLLKDNLAQACMRMRKLAFEQRVRFYAPPETDHAIRSLLKDPSEELTSLHVVRYCINESCSALKKQGPLYATRGLLHSRRRLAMARHRTPQGMIVAPDRYLATIRERESRPVSELYRVGPTGRKELPFDPTEEEKFDTVMKDLLAEFERTNVSDCLDSGITEEQEREILHEVQQERELQKPRSVEPALPQVCAALHIHIKDGTPPRKGCPDLVPAFELLLQTRLQAHYNRNGFPCHVAVTRDFTRTVLTVQGLPEDDFLRPVQWILKFKESRTLIIISPHEAQEFLPAIRESKSVSLHTYQARTSRGMPPFDGLTYCTTPESAKPLRFPAQGIAMLNLFAGQLYFSSFRHYKEFCTLTGLYDGERPLPHRRQVADDNFVSPLCRKSNGWKECTFSSSPVSWIKAFIDMRRLGIEWSHTHVGRVLNGQILRREEFEEEDAEFEEDLVDNVAMLTVDERNSEDVEKAV
ncbi:hypothetical protein H2200_000832 [Cladophialophora chaetospira]|uniref:ubiquitinyl hydrolase 1 n=1 Tax=Cladophialophora chaetospira TaxID=386627 RepID=A0AA39CRD7_9EURO|nr:hypothetical protein H2200_000832 [Cladophialophora chaetospira]